MANRVGSLKILLLVFETSTSDTENIKEYDQTYLKNNRSFYTGGGRKNER
jgi:hypothetical protein